MDDQEVTIQRDEDTDEDEMPDTDLDAVAGGVTTFPPVYQRIPGPSYDPNTTRDPGGPQP